MSEYQYYEFCAIDRPLTSEQKAAMRGLSSRVVLSSHRAAFTYSYGSFRGEPLNVLEAHFDMLFYIANWGSKQLAFRFPKGAVDPEQLRPYTLDDEENVQIDLQITPQYLLLNLATHNQDGYGWIDGEGLIDALVPLREAILNGDLRTLYLVWLRAAPYWVRYAEEGLDDEELEPLTEPPVPAGLGQLDEAHQALVELFEIDADLLAAAAEASPPLKRVNEPLAEWVKLLPAAEGEEFLVRVAKGDGQVQGELLRRLRELGGSPKAALSSAPQRRFSEIESAAQRQRDLRQQRAREAAKQARLAKLAALAEHEEQIWASVASLLAKRNAGGYDQGVAQLAELRDLAVHRGTRAAFDARLAALTAPYSNSPALQRRLKEL